MRSGNVSGISVSWSEAAIVGPMYRMDKRPRLGYHIPRLFGWIIAYTKSRGSSIPEKSLRMCRVEYIPASGAVWRMDGKNRQSEGVGFGKECIPIPLRV